MASIVTHYDPKPIPDRRFDWIAYDESTYDGAEDSSTRNEIGYGRTEADALADLQRLMSEKADWAEWDAHPERVEEEAA